MKTLNLLIAIVCLGITLGSCKKDSNDTDDNPPLPSHKLKRVIQALPGVGKAFIVDVQYDANNRVTNFNEFSVDSSTTPVTVTDANYSFFVYNGTSELPVKNILTDENGHTDSTLYFYDAQNRIIKEDYYYNGNVIRRNTYDYPSATVIKANSYEYLGSALELRGSDSMLIDAQNRIYEIRFYNAALTYSGKTNYQYDNKINPLSNLNVFKYVFSLYGDDRKDFYRSANNYIFSTTITSSTITYTNTFIYDSGSYPVSAVFSYNSSSGTENYNVLFQYY